MKLQAKRKEDEKLIFQWDNKEIKKGIAGSNKQSSLDDYLDFLNEIKPNKQELIKTKIFKIPFTLKVKNKEDI